MRRRGGGAWFFFGSLVGLFRVFFGFFFGCLDPKIPRATAIGRRSNFQPLSRFAPARKNTRTRAEKKLKTRRHAGTHE